MENYLCCDLIIGLGYQYPKLQISVTFMLYFAFINGNIISFLKFNSYIFLILELLHNIFSKLVDFQPIMTRAEVNKVSVTHYFDPKKPQEELEYFPIVSPKVAMERTVSFWQTKLKYIYLYFPVSLIDDFVFFST